VRSTVRGDKGGAKSRVAPSRTALYCTMMEPRGIYRERNGWGTQHSAHVKYDEHQELDVSEDRYRERGYQPPFDQLPWKGEVEDRKP
jgi:hypothetical protein